MVPWSVEIEDNFDRLLIYYLDIEEEKEENPSGEYMEVAGAWKMGRWVINSPVKTF